jgi:hypothetical protein
MTAAEIKSAIADRAKNGKMNTTINATDKDGHKYTVRVIAMPELSGGEINGTAAVVIDGQHCRDMTLAQVAPIFDHMVSVTI